MRSQKSGISSSGEMRRPLMAGQERGMEHIAPVLSESLNFIIVILVGFFLKRIGILEKRDGDILSKIIVYVTLPCALLGGASEMRISGLTVKLIALAVLLNVIVMQIGKFAARKREPVTRAAYMINSSGYNVGCFALPFVESFFPGAGVSYLCMFDTGNAIMGLGGIYSIARSEARGEKKLNLGNLIRTILKSVPFDTYLVIFICSLMQIKLPLFVLNAAGLMGKGNAFLTMLMTGVLLEIHIPKEEIHDVVRVMGIRVFVNLFLGILLYGFFPAPLLARKVVLLTLVCPPASVAVVFSKMCGYDRDMPAVVSSVHILLSMIEMTVILAVIA